jgi:hypothetical protein
MKHELTILILTIFICSSCTHETQKTVKEIKTNIVIDSSNQKTSYDTIFVDKTYVGMTLTKLKAIYKNLEFIEEPMFFYGVDSEENGWLLKKDNKPFIFVWTQENSDIINGITILTDQIIIDNNVHIGITVKDFFNKYKNAKLQIDAISNDTEFGYVMNNLNYRVEFLTKDSNRVGEYDLTQAEPEFIKLKRPDAKVERIGVYN